MNKKIIIKETENLRNTKLSNQNSIVTDVNKSVIKEKLSVCIYEEGQSYL